MSRAPKVGAGFTLVEVLVVLAVLGLALLFVQPNAARARTEAETALMRQRAALLEGAMAQYEGVVGEAAAGAAWSGAANDEARYALVRSFLAWPPPTLADYAVRGFVVQFGATPAARLLVRRDDGEPVYP